NGLSPSIAGYSFQLAQIGKEEILRINANPANKHFVDSILQMGHQNALWAKYGYNLYDVTDSLAAALLMTDPPPLTEENFQLPFPAFAIRVPDGYLPYYFRLKGQVWSNLVWVHRYIDVEEIPRYQVTVFYQGQTLYRRERIERLTDFKLGDQLFPLDDDPVMTKDDDITLS